MLGSFIFGLPTDNADTFAATADLAQRSGVSFAQFVMLTPFPGTVDFAKWEQEASGRPDGQRHPAHTLLADPVRRSARRSTSPHPTMTADEIRRGTQDVWDRFYSLPAIWQRSACVDRCDRAWRSS